MKLQKIIFAPLLLLCLFFQNNSLFSQNIVATGDYIERMKTNPSSMTFEFNDSYQNFTVEIAGPEDFYLRKEMKQINEIALSSIGFDDETFEDGGYKIQITPNFELSKAEQKVLRYLTETDQREKLKAEKELLNIPTEVQNYTRYFTILGGEFVLPKNERNGLKLRLPGDNRNPTKNLTTLRLATNNAKPTFTGLSTGMGLNKPKPMFANLGLDPQPIFVDQVILDDLIVDGSACIGFDCVNGESFGFDTIRMKENNLRIRAQDTSNSASFPSRDWQITFNDTANGGANKFSIDDIDGGRTPFTIEAGTPSHSLYVDDGGRIGIGTSTPVVDIHNKAGNTPTLRLEQDGSSGFTPQTWDVASNEANFFIRDATNGSTLPFRIRPGAPSSAIDIAASGNVGLGSTAPAKPLHLRNATPAIRLESLGEGENIWDIEIVNSGFNIVNVSSVQTALSIVNSTQLKLNQYIGGNFDNANPLFALTLDGSGNVTKSPYGGGGGSADVDWLKTDNNPASSLNDNIYTLGSVAIGGLTLEQALHVTGNVAISGSILPVSDRRLKKEVNPIENALETIQKLNATSYYFKTEKFGDMNLPTKLQYGFIAQEIQEVLPALVTESNNPDKEKAFMRLNYTGVIPFLVKGMQEQQAIIEAQQERIEALEQKVNEMDQLKEQVAALAKMMGKDKEGLDSSMDSEKR